MDEALYQDYTLKRGLVPRGKGHYIDREETTIARAKCFSSACCSMLPRWMLQEVVLDLP
jgi:hypothetical protein